MSEKKPSESQSIPFGAMERPTEPRSSRGPSRSSQPDSRSTATREDGGARRPRRRGRRRRNGPANGAPNGVAPDSSDHRNGAAAPASGEARERDDAGSNGRNGGGRGRSRRGRGGKWSRQPQGGARAEGGPNSGRANDLGQTEGLYMTAHAKHGELRDAARSWIPNKLDVHVAPWLVQKYGLRDGAIVKGRYGRGHGRHRLDLLDVERVDGLSPEEAKRVPAFQGLTSIDPDFHYAVGDPSGDLSLRILDLLCPVGRGQRGLIVAPPRSGKTILLQKFAKAIEDCYEDVHPIILLVDERPEEATEWTRTMKRGQVFVSTNDEPAKHHVELCEAVWRRCRRMVELGQDVVLVLDSITRMGRAYNNVHGNSGKTMSGGIDSRAMERPKQFFGAARNTETAGSLTILGTTLVDTGSRMDQVIFEEFKGTGNMELVLNRRLADRRIFPAIDVEKSGTRKEEKLISSDRLRLVHTLRRVLTRMHFAEAMELLITRLDESATNDDFLARFAIDPDE